MTQTFHNWLFPNTKTNEMLVTTMWETKHARLKRCSRFYLTALPVSCDTRHVFPPPQSAHGLTLSQTNWSFLCEYRTFNPSETWHAVLSSMNASLLDLSLCCVLGGQQGDVLPWTQLRHSHVQVRNSFDTRGRWRWPRCASVCSLMQIITCVLYPVSLSSLGFVDIALVEVEAGGAACLCTHI